MVRAGDLIVLDGPLGAGKTVFVQGLAGRARSARTGDLADLRHRPGASRADGCRWCTSTRTGSPAGSRSTTSIWTPTSPTAVVAVEWGAGLVEGLTDAHLRVELRAARAARAMR